MVVSGAQLNRLVNMDAYNTPWGTPATTTNYREAISYDPNGNIRTYLRNGAGSTNAMDSLTYQYEKDPEGQISSNKLRYLPLPEFPRSRQCGLYGHRDHLHSGVK